MGTHKSFNMKVIAVLCLFGAVFAAEDALRGILKSNKDTLQLYSAFKTTEGLNYATSEDRMRFRLFRKSAEEVVNYNENSESAVFGLNFFSSMTAAEKQQYLGLNITNRAPNAPALKNSGFAAPEKVLWTNLGGVTKVKNQGSCGSCWTFGAVGGPETRYQVASGVLRNFAEQEYLDCVYSSRDGCNGGWPSDCYDYSKKSGGRLASTTDYVYQATDGSCKGSSKADSMVSAKITGYSDVPSGESSNIQALVDGALAVAFEVTNYFQQYRGGIIKDTTCSGRPNHAVTAVGYAAKFVLVKNSWGSSWGDNGFVKFTRGYSNCGLFGYSSYPTLSKTGKSDSNPDAATPYRPSENDDGPAPVPDPDCEDKAITCVPDFCQYSNIAEQYCRKTCGLCDDDDDGGDCPSGTVRCSDGVCRHEHMC